jgi:hypothetical protein
MSDLAPYLLLAGLIVQGCVLGANVFEAVVDVPNWSQPGGVAAYRSFIRARHAGHFYRVLSPLSIVLLAAALATGWSALLHNAAVGTALAAAVFAEIHTVVYFFPRNARLFFSADQESFDVEQRLVAEWGRANLLRCAVVLVGLTAGLSAGMGLLGA